jgi:tripartite-type tricarboxylate transporter receptor subunit TctC
MSDVPTLAEQGVPNIEVKGWWALFGPANMPGAVVEQLNAAVREALKTPAVQARIQNLYAEVWSGSPRELDDFVRREIPSISRLAKKAGIEPE